MKPIRNKVLNRSPAEMQQKQSGTVLHVHQPVTTIPNWGIYLRSAQGADIYDYILHISLWRYPLKHVYCTKFILIKSQMVLPRFVESWLHGWSGGAPAWQTFRKEGPERNLSWRKDRNRVVLLSLTYVAPVCCHIQRLGDALGLKSIVCAAVVQVMTETADHQS